MTTNNNHFRVTAYHLIEDISALVDSFVVYAEIWVLSSMLVMKGFIIIAVSDSSKFVDVNLPTIEPNSKQLYLRACMSGMPDELLKTIDGRSVKVIQVENRMYIPDNTSRG